MSQERTPMNDGTANTLRTPGAPASIPPLNHFLRDAWATSEDVFAASYPGRFLILESSSTAPLNLPNNMMLRTVTISAVIPGQERALLDVVPVVKRPGNNPFTSMITLGRARNNDIVVNDASVSKMHAWIRHSSDTLDGLSATLTDSGSTNGTYVDGKPVVATSVALGVGARIRLGSVEFWFVDGVLLHRALRRRARPNRIGQ